MKSVSRCFPIFVSCLCASLLGSPQARFDKSWYRGAYEQIESLRASLGESDAAFLQAIETNALDPSELLRLSDALHKVQSVSKRIIYYQTLENEHRSFLESDPQLEWMWSLHSVVLARSVALIEHDFPKALDLIDATLFMAKLSTQAGGLKAYVQKEAIKASVCRKLTTVISHLSKGQKQQLFLKMKARPHEWEWGDAIQSERMRTTDWLLHQIHLRLSQEQKMDDALGRSPFPSAYRVRRVLNTVEPPRLLMSDKHKGVSFGLSSESQYDALSLIKIKKGDYAIINQGNRYARVDLHDLQIHALPSYLSDAFLKQILGETVVADLLQVGSWDASKRLDELRRVDVEWESFKNVTRDFDKAILGKGMHVSSVPQSNPWRALFLSDINAFLKAYYHSYLYYQTFMDALQDP